jgi:O-antigen ligase
MRPAVILAIAYVLIALNLHLLTGIDFANYIERGGFLAAAVYFCVRRGVHGPVLGIGVAVIGLIVFLGAISPYEFLDWGNLTFSLNQVVTVYLLLAARYSPRDGYDVLRIAAAAPILIVVMGLVYQMMGFWSVFGRGFSEDSGRLQGSLIPAFLAGYALCGTFAAVQLGATTHRRTFYALAILNCAILLMTGARAPAAIGLPLALVYIILSPQVGVRTKIAAPAVVLVTIAGLVMTVGQELIGRLVAGGSSGREEMWAYFERMGQEYYWTGIGYMQSYYVKLPHELATRVNSTAVHNDYVRLAAELGTPGTVVFYLLLTGAFAYAALRNGGWRGLVVSLLAYLGFLAYSWSDNAFGTASDYMLMVLGVIAGMRVIAPQSANQYRTVLSGRSAWRVRQDPEAQETA